MAKLNVGGNKVQMYINYIRYLNIQSDSSISIQSNYRKVMKTINIFKFLKQNIF